MEQLRKIPWWVPGLASLGLGLMGAVAATLFSKWVQELLFALGAACVLWSAAIIGFRAIMHRRLERSLPPTLYLRNNDGRSPHFTDKMFGIKWREEELSLTFRGEGGDGLDRTPIREKDITFDLFNAGDEAVRDVVVRWRLPDVDIGELVKVLGSPVRGFENHQLKLAKDGRGSIHYVVTDVSSETIPLIDKRETVSVAAPRAFTEAYSICALARAKGHHEQVVLPSMGSAADDPLSHLERWKRRMDPMVVELSYVKNGRRCKHAFTIHAFVWGGGQPIVPQPTEESPNMYAPTAGISACVDHVTVVPYER